MMVLSEQIQHLLCIRLLELVAVAGVLRFVGVKCSPQPAVPANIDTVATVAVEVDKVLAAR